jgi:hypothetical protein
MRKTSKCSNFNKNWYEGFSPHEECDSDKSDFFFVIGALEHFEICYVFWRPY